MKSQTLVFLQVQRTKIRARDHKCLIVFIFAVHFASHRECQPYLEPAADKEPSSDDCALYKKSVSLDRAMQLYRGTWHFCLEGVAGLAAL